MVHFDPSRGLIEFKGNSTPSNSLNFYQSIIMHLDEYMLSEEKGLIANMAFQYFNTSSSKCLYDLLKRLSSIHQKGRQVTVNWYYKIDDEEMREVGRDFSEIMDLEFNFIELAS